MSSPQNGSSAEGLPPRTSVVRVDTPIVSRGMVLAAGAGAVGLIVGGSIGAIVGAAVGALAETAMSLHRSNIGE
jgi:hypothetical protein